MSGERRRQKSLRIGVHHANGVVWGPVYRTHLIRNPSPSLWESSSTTTTTTTTRGGGWGRWTRGVAVSRRRARRARARRRRERSRSSSSSSRPRLNDLSTDRSQLAVLQKLDEVSEDAVHARVPRASDPVLRGRAEHGLVRLGERIGAGASWGAGWGGGEVRCRRLEGNLSASRK